MKIKTEYGEPYRRMPHAGYRQWLTCAWDAITQATVVMHTPVKPTKKQVRRLKKKLGIKLGKQTNE